MKDIAEYEKLYAVTRDGRIWSYRRKAWMKPYMNKRGYYQVTLNRNKNLRCFWVHRLVASAYITPVDNKLYVNHKNGLKTDNRAANLEWCTQRENIVHALNTGLRRVVDGESHPNAKLSNRQVGEIREQYGRGNIRQWQLGLAYGVKQSTISQIIKHKARVSS